MKLTAVMWGTVLCAALCAAGAEQSAAVVPAVPVEAAAKKSSETFIDRAEFEAEFALYLEKLRGTGAERVDPAMTVESEEPLDGYVRRLVAYNVEAGERITGWLLVPAGLQPGEKRPLVMCLHGTSLYGKDAPVEHYTEYPTEDKTELGKRRQRAFATQLVKRGFVCFAPDRAGYGKRVLPGSTGKAIPQMQAYTRDFKARYPDWNYDHGKVVHDLQQALDFLVKLDFVDGERIGTIGHSLGGHDSIKLAANDRRVTAVVNSCGGGFDYRPELWTDPAALKAAVAAGKFTLHSERNLFYQAIAPRGMLTLIGMNDVFSPVKMLPAAELMTAYYQRQLPQYGLQRREPFAMLVHTAGHSIPDGVRAYAYAWLEKQLMPER